MPIRWIDGLSKEIHHIKVMDSDSEDYEPTLVILDHRHPGKSFQIPVGAMWKYIDPSDNQDERTLAADRQEFEKMKDNITFKKKIAFTHEQMQEVIRDTACCIVAETFARGMKFLLCTAWNIAKMMQMFDIPVSPQNAAHLLMWVQDALDDLKNAPPAPLPEDTFFGGEMQLFQGSQKISDRPMIMKESDLIVEGLVE